MAGPWDKYAAPSGGFALGAPSPDYQKGAATLPFAVPQVQSSINSANASAASSAASAARTRAELPYVGTQAQAEAARAQAEAQQAQLKAQAAAKEQANAPDPQSAKIADILQTDNVLRNLDIARGQIGAGYSTGNFFGGGTFAEVPVLGQNATNLAATLDGIKGSVINDTLKQLKAASASGASGYGALSDSEGNRLAASVAALQQSQDSNALLNNLANVELHYRNSRALLNNEDPRNPDVAKKYGISLDGTAPPAGGGGGNGPSGNLQLSQNGYETVNDPTLQGVNQQVRAMIGKGASQADISAYLNQVRPGLGNQLAGDIGANVQFRNQHPNVSLDQYKIDLENKNVPLSPIHSAVNTAAQSAPGAFALNAADALTAGYLDNMTSNPALARAGIRAVSSQHDIASPLGQIGGGALAAGLGEGLAARLGLQGVAGLRAADAGYGALYGSGNNDDNRLGGAVTGAAAGLAGGMFGRAATRVGGRAVAGVQDAAKRALADSGVPLTLGQALGGGAKSLEDRLAGYWGVGDLINARRKEGTRAFQNAAFDEGLSSIGGSTNGDIAESGVASALRQVGKAYDDALGGVNVTTDLPYKQANAQLGQQVSSIPRVGPEVAAGIDAIVSPMFNGGHLSGQSMQAIDRGLQQLRSGYSNDPLFATHIAPAIDAVGSNIEGLFSRQAPAVLPKYQAAKQAYRNTSVLADAVNSGVNTGGEFTAAQLGQQSRKNAIKFGGRNSAASGSRPFAVLQRAAQEVLPSKIADSGTAGRLAIPTIAAALGAGGGAATGEEGSRAGHAARSAVALGALASLPYSKAAQGAVTKLLLQERPDLLIQLGNGAVKNARIGGMFANPAALQYFAGPKY